MKKGLKQYKQRKIFKIMPVAIGGMMVAGICFVNSFYYVLRESMIEQGMVSGEMMDKLDTICGICLAGGVLLLILMLVYYIFQIRHNRFLENMVYVDAITGGSSYEKFKMDFEKQISKDVSNTYAVLSIDIDKSKYIEEIFGVDEYLRAVHYLWEAVEQETREGELCGHKEADLFYAILKYENDEIVKQRIQRINDDVKMKIEHGELFYDIKISTGVYILNNRRHSIERILYRGDVARKTIKGHHDKLCGFYTEEMKKEQVKNQEIENKMEKALARGEFYVCYQPKYNTQNKKIVGAEALVRWKMNGENVIPPSEFIPLFESNGFIKDLDKFVFEQVCKDVSTWLDKGLKVKPVSVNLSQMQLYNSNFIKEYAEILERYDLGSEYVQLELTETAMFDNPVVLAKIINQLHSMGFTILMDDFGTGYSSLNMLKDVEVDTVKIDKSFVDDIGNNQKVERIIATIISLVRSLNMHVVAEGVENEMQYKFLHLVECDEIQGYYFSKPISGKEYEILLEKEVGC